MSWRAGPLPGGLATCLAGLAGWAAWNTSPGRFPDGRQMATISPGALCGNFVGSNGQESK